MSRILYPLIGLFAVFLVCSCEFTNRMSTEFRGGARAENLRLTFEKGACFGDCPVYQLEVYNHGLLVYKGKRFTDKPGVWHLSADRREITSLLDSVNTINWKAYPTTFPSRLPDLAATTITWFDGAQQPTAVSFKEETSPELRRLAERLEQLTTYAGYRQISGSINGASASGTTDREEIIVLLDQGADAGAWVRGYAKQGVALKERVTPNGDYYVVLANPNIMGAEELLKWLRRDEAVLSAQLNQAASPR